VSPNSSETPDYTMLSRRWSGQTLISVDIAIQLARLVHEEQYGQSALREEEPLSVEEDGDCWVVKGAKALKYDVTTPKLDGPMEMRISKFDGQILSYAFVAPLPRP